MLLISHISFVRLYYLFCLCWILEELHHSVDRFQGSYCIQQNNFMLSPDRMILWWMQKAHAEAEADHQEAIKKEEQQAENSLAE